MLFSRCVGISFSLRSQVGLEHDQMSDEAIFTAALERDAPMQTIGQQLVWAARADLTLTCSDHGQALLVGHIVYSLHK